MALAVHHKTVGEQPRVGRAAVNGTAVKQRGLEPAAVLVRTFKIKVSGIALVVALAQNRGMRGALVEPDIKRIGHLAIIFGFVSQ